MVNYLHNFDRTKFDIRVVLPKDSQLIPFVAAEHYPIPRFPESWRRGCAVFPAVSTPGTPHFRRRKS